MSYKHDDRIVMTLDAGGTNFVFSAMQGNKEIIENIVLPSNADNLEKCLDTLVEGFTQVSQKLSSKPAAISFAFPGPADYPNGIIGPDLPNFPAFKTTQGVPVGPFLEERFGIPVYINNDGDLFAYGEALAGVLPEINNKLEKAGSIKQYKNLLGVTFGTGFGAGIVLNGELLMGDNACAAEIFCNRNTKYPQWMVEESVSIRGVKFAYANFSGDKNDALTPKDIFDIAEGVKPGNKEAAQNAFAELGSVAGDTLANIITMIDGLIVIGGGLASAHKYFMPALIDQLNSRLGMMNGGFVTRIPQKAYNLVDEKEFALFAKGDKRAITIPGTTKTVDYDPERRIGVAISQLGTSRSAMVGAYAYALHMLDKREA